jgi:hypothetical protein
LGIARETTLGTYVAPEKFFPIINETLHVVPNNIQRRGIRQVADVLSLVQGPSHVEGAIECEIYEDILPYLLGASRTNRATTGSTNYLHTFSAAHCRGLGTLGKSLSITVVRSGTVEAYVGCMVSSFEITTDEGILKGTFNIIGLDEATQADPTEVYSALDVPFAAGMYDIEIPDGTDVSDVESFTFNVEDNLEHQYRLRTTRAASFSKFGERTVTLSMMRDFVDRTDYDAFKAMTPQAIAIRATRGANNYVEIQMPVATKETYEFNLSGVGDLVMANIEYTGTYDPTAAGGYKILVANQNAMA